MALIAPSRRRLLHFAAAAAVAPGLAGLKARPVIGRVLAVSDLHSAYERTPYLLAAFEHEIRSHPVPHVIAINGDIFEQGNVVAQRSDGAVDWAFLAALPALAPTVVNLGNHDNDLTPDLADVVARMKGLGLHVVSTISDTRTGAGYASPTATLPFGDHRLRVVGMATNSMNTYPKASRDQLSIPAAADWARANLSDSLSGADKVMVMSHAGVVADRDILPLLPEGALMVGRSRPPAVPAPAGRQRLCAHGLVHQRLYGRGVRSGRFRDRRLASGFDGRPRLPRPRGSDDEDARG